MATAAYRDSIQSTLNKIQPLKCLIKVKIIIQVKIFQPGDMYICWFSIYFVSLIHEL